MSKTYVLDTNILLQDPDCIYNFDEHEVIIPIGVIEELDKFKKEHGELGKNSREVARSLDKLSAEGDLKVGVDVHNGHGGKIRVYYNGNLSSYYKETNVDLHVIYVAHELKKECKNSETVVIVSNDVNVRIRARALGLIADGYTTQQVKSEINRGYEEILCDFDIMDELKVNGKLEMDKFICIDPSKYNPNYYFDVRSNDSKRVSRVLAKISPDKQFIEMLNVKRDGLRIKPKNIEQTFAFDALLDSRIKLVSILGLAGSGKTLISAGCGLYMLEKTEEFRKLLVSRPMIPMGNKDVMGFLPGDIAEKISPWLRPIYDAFEVILNPKKSGGKSRDKEEMKERERAFINGEEYVQQSKFIDIEPLAYIRGRSISDQFMIIDESQNLNPLELKTIITRAGENTKIVLTGDISQIDCPYLDQYSNGLTVSTNAFLDSSLSAHLVMTSGVRSKLSEEATKRL